MRSKKSYRFENITILCDETCPIYYCGDPCRVRDHVEKYSKIMDEESSYTIL